MPLPALQRGLNSLLPDDIAVSQVTEVPMDFHARYAARQKTYAYVVHNHPVRSASRSALYLVRAAATDVSAMRTAAQVLVGRHDFSAFRAASCAARSPRVVCSCRRETPCRPHFFVICADGFCTHGAQHRWYAGRHRSRQNPLPRP